MIDVQVRTALLANALGLFPRFALVLEHALSRDRAALSLGWRRIVWDEARHASPTLAHDVENRLERVLLGRHHFRKSLSDLLAESFGILAAREE